MYFFFFNGDKLISSFILLHRFLQYIYRVLHMFWSLNPYGRATSKFFNMCPFGFYRRKSVIQLWRIIRVSEWWQITLFPLGFCYNDCVNDTFEISNSRVLARLLGVRCNNIELIIKSKDIIPKSKTKCRMMSWSICLIWDVLVLKSNNQMCFIK